MALAEELDAVLREAVERNNVTGAAAGFVTDDETVMAAAGVTNVERPAAVDAETLFQVASITKTFTATAIGLLVEEGALALDDPVSRHVPHLGDTTGLDLDAMTVEHLVTHQAGFDGDHLFVHGATDTLDALRDARRFFAPGTGFSYNNAAFSIAGAVIEAVSGRSFESFVRRRLLQPLGMTSACFRADDAITYPVALPHLVVGTETGVLRRAGWQPGWELTAVDRPAGGLVASAQHLLTWCRFQWTGTAVDGTTLVSQSTLDRLHAPVVNATRWTDIALDWHVERTDGVTTIEHSGLTVGYCSDLVVVPSRRVGFVCLTNSTNGAAVNEAVRRWTLERVAGLRETDPSPDASIRVDVERCTGQFLAPFGLLTIRPGETTRSGTGPTLAISTTQREDVDGWKPPPDPTMTFAFATDDHIVSIDAPGPVRVARFGFGGDGRAEWILWGSRRAPRVR
jgi:CubicO group peptidase (beta-lactamase class C family)